MSTPGTTTALSMTPGTYISISIPSDTEVGQGEFKRDETNKVKLNGESRDHYLGFVSEYLTVGTIEEDLTNPDVQVIYTHLQNKPNRIFFYSVDDIRHTISIVSMPIHDHSSMYQGGPAYGTYAYDKPVEEPEE